MEINNQEDIERTLYVGELSSRKRGRKIQKIIRILFMILFSVFILLPIFFIISTSLKNQIEIRAGGTLIPQQGISLINWKNAWETQPLMLFLRNSTIIAVFSTLFVMLIAVPTSYAIVRFNVGGDILPSLVLGGYVMPPIVVSIPIFMMVRSIGWTDTLQGMILVHTIINTPVAVWLLDSFVRSLPKELEEAAWIDGYSKFDTLFKVVLPLMRPGLISTGIIALIQSWNEFLLALLLTADPKDAQTFPVGLSSFIGQHGLKFGEMSAAALSGIIPIYIIVFIFQRYVVAGITRGGVKG